MPEQDIEALRAAIAALEGQRATLGDEVLALALAPLHARLSHLAGDAERERVIADSSSYAAMGAAYRRLHGAPAAAG